MYARVDAPDLETDGEGGSTLAVGEIEKLGAATLTKIRTWVGHHQVVIQPVLNMARRDAVDSHDPPGWMRDLVLLRDGHCIFPQMHRRRPLLRPRPHDPLRPRRTTRPNQRLEPRLPVPATPPRQDHRSLAIPPHARRRLPLARPVRHDVPRHALRHPPSDRSASLRCPRSRCESRAPSHRPTDAAPVPTSASGHARRASGAAGRPALLRSAAIRSAFRSWMRRRGVNRPARRHAGAAGWGSPTPCHPLRRLPPIGQPDQHLLHLRRGNVPPLEGGATFGGYVPQPSPERGSQSSASPATDAA